ncbi:hypothetical protein [Plasmodium yoelii yoelii]|uniref:Uncharacterized protein n=1 Tax=Plasmodium yoelii yoelii TaxID=73239 RepID=Q7RCF5_PLAYO|nr:hypothetical protein [Plasmodium yoelii yoelii]
MIKVNNYITYINSYYAISLGIIIIRFI